MVIEIRKTKAYSLVFTFLLLSSIAVSIPVKITEPHTRFNPWMNECVYFFTLGQCYVDPDYCSKEYGKNAMEDTLITLDKEKECIYSREEYRKYLEEKKEKTERKVEIKKGPFEFVVEETEYVSLLPKGYDPDDDNIIYHFTAPLNVKGGWQTDYGDAGEYTITVTASDGELSSSKDVLLVVTKKEEVPVIESFGPLKEVISADENSKVDFNIVASDKNKDELSYIWKLDNEEVSAEESYTYNIGYDDAGQHIVIVAVTDSFGEVIKEWTVNVRNVNRKPILEKIADVNVKETELIVLEAKASDQDKGDELTFTIGNDKFEQIDNQFEWQTTYEDSGEYTVTITISDGEDEISQTLKITVENVNRPPVIIDVWNEG